MAAPAVVLVSAVKFDAGEQEAIQKNLETELKQDVGIVYYMNTLTANLTSKDFYNAEQKLWSDTEASAPILLRSRYYTNERINGPAPTGVKFGRVYFDAQDELPTTRKFIIAFDSPARKVYGETGPTGPVDWEVVEDRLSKSGSEIDIIDETLGGRIRAGVYANGNAYVHFMDAS